MKKIQFVGVNIHAPVVTSWGQAKKIRKRTTTFQKSNKSFGFLNTEQNIPCLYFCKANKNNIKGIRFPVANFTVKQTMKWIHFNAIKTQNQCAVVASQRVPAFYTLLILLFCWWIKLIEIWRKKKPVPIRGINPKFLPTYVMCNSTKLMYFNFRSTRSTASFLYNESINMR